MDAGEQAESLDAPVPQLGLAGPSTRKSSRIRTQKQKQPTSSTKTVEPLGTGKRKPVVPKSGLPVETKPKKAKQTKELSKPKKAKESSTPKKSKEPAKPRKAKESSKPRKEIASSVFSEELVDNPDDPSDGTPVPLSGASLEVLHSSKKTRVPPQPSECNICKKSLSSKTRLKIHLMRHKINDVNSRKIISFHDFSLEAKACDALKEMSNDPGEGKKEYVESIISHASGDMSGEWQQFVSVLTEPMLQSFTKATSALPSQQYEDQLIGLNKFLNDEPVFSSLASEFNTFSDKSNDQLSRVVLTHLCFKLLNAMLKFQFQAMKLVVIQSVPDVDVTSTINRDDFEVHARKFIQMYYLKGVNSGSTRMLARCACIRVNFIESQCDIDSTAIITNNASWERDTDGVVRLSLQESVVNFSVEKIICSLKIPTTDEVLNILLERNILLEPWYLLTNNAFEEDEALMFFK